MSSRVSERAGERMSAANARAKRAERSKRMMERCKPMDKEEVNNPVIYASIS